MGLEIVLLCCADCGAFQLERFDESRLCVQRNGGVKFEGGKKVPKV